MIVLYDRSVEFRWSTFSIWLGLACLETTEKAQEAPRLFARFRRATRSGLPLACSRNRVLVFQTSTSSRYVYTLKAETRSLEWRMPPRNGRETKERVGLNKRRGGGCKYDHQDGELVGALVSGRSSLHSLWLRCPIGSRMMTLSNCRLPPSPTAAQRLRRFTFVSRTLVIQPMHLLLKESLPSVIPSVFLYYFTFPWHTRSST